MRRRVTRQRHHGSLAATLLFIASALPAQQPLRRGDVAARLATISPLMPHAELAPLLDFLATDDGLVRAALIRLCLQRPDLLCEKPRWRQLDARVLAAFHGGPADTRRGLGVLLRQHFDVPVDDLELIRDALIDAFRESLANGAAGLLPVDAAARLPWRAHAEALRPLAAVTAALWRAADDERRVHLLPLLVAMGPAAAFAADDLLAWLARPGLATREVATILSTTGHDSDLAGARQQAVERFAAAADDDLVSRIAAVHALGEVDAAQRTTLALRVLDAVERRGIGGLANLDWGAGELLPSARERFEQFFTGGRKRGWREDPLATAIAARVFANFPDLAIMAVKTGIARDEAILAATATPPAGTLADIGDELVAIGARHDTARAGATIGRVLAAGSSPPVAALLAQIGPARVFAFHALGALGSKAQPAIEMLAEHAAGNDNQTKFLAAHALAAIGPTGIARIGRMLPRSPELIAAIDRVLATGDAADLGSAANLLLTLRPQQHQARAKALRDAIARCRDPRSIALLSLALRQFDPTGSPADWLRLRQLEPALIRRRALATMPTGKLSPLQLGSIVELLDDPDATVRVKALDIILADPRHVARCLTPLQEQLGRADLEPQSGARIRMALGR